MIMDKDMFFNINDCKKYEKNQLVNVAKRDNNTKRPFLFVNPMQGKHIPVSPTKSIELFAQLANKLFEKYNNERLLLIGFAETATAIGAAVACFSPIDTYYLQTTRENIINAEYLYFTESHSHATEQRLVKNNLVDILSKTDRIVFVEDEVTTGNTIMKIVDIICKEYQHLNLKFGICSILNSMTDERIQEISNKNIECTYILKLNLENSVNITEQYTYSEDLKKEIKFSKNSVSEITIKGKCNPRIGVLVSKLKNNCLKLVENVLSEIDCNDLKGKNILVLGCEEFMFPPMYIAHYIEQKCGCKSVRFHATTRSPILPSNDENYPLNTRYKLESVYESDRINFVYNLQKYDKVIIIHDSVTTNLNGLNGIVAAFNSMGCNDITAIRWTD